MTFSRLVISTVLVSITFGIWIYVITTMLWHSDSWLTRGVLYLGILPALAGALINKTGYLYSSEAISELLGPPTKQEQSKMLFWIAGILLSAVVLGPIFFKNVLGEQMAIKMWLVVLGICWGTVVTRAWIIYRCLTRRSTGRAQTTARAG
jgi:hypothetical protein